MRTDRVAPSDGSAPAMPLDLGLAPRRSLPSDRMNPSSQLPGTDGAGNQIDDHAGPREVALHAAVILLLTGGCLASVATGRSSPIRVVLSLSFLLFVPGLALAEALGIRDLAQRVAIGTIASLGVETLVALALVYAHAFSIGLAMPILAALTVTSVGWALVRAWRLQSKAGVSSPPGA